MEGLVCSNAVVLEGFLSSLIEAVVLETAIAAWKALALSLFMIGSLPNRSSDIPEESGTSRGLGVWVNRERKLGGLSVLSASWSKRLWQVCGHILAANASESPSATIVAGFTVHCSIILHCNAFTINLLEVRTF
ncbi:hypothetical protein H0E87_030032 [Populus deltoides]|uniref:Uncharacterized protein n=1 Tax=Populus deltoides TaxID=3696 RepID=A0A8T2WRN5_POPDE|nr:hypothetical protein H0E87_030032 [Populus deltoides]